MDSGGRNLEVDEIWKWAEHKMDSGLRILEVGGAQSGLVSGIWKWAEHKVKSGERNLEVGGA